MTFGGLAALFGTLLVLGLMPSASSLVVAARSSSAGVRQGVATAVGVVVGDVAFVSIAVLGLAAVVDSLGPYFELLRYVGAAFLAWMGLGLLRSRSRPSDAEELVNVSSSSSLLAGLLITLADQKAIFFYLGLFPAFMDLSSLTRVDIAVLLAVTIASVGGAKLVYALAAERARSWLTPTLHRRLTAVSGGIMIAIALYIVVRG